MNNGSNPWPCPYLTLNGESDLADFLVESAEIELDMMCNTHLH